MRELLSFPVADYRKASLVPGQIVSLHPLFLAPESFDPIAISLNLRRNQGHVTPTGLRTVENPFYSKSDGRTVYKGLFSSPVHIYGPQAEAILKARIARIKEEGNFGGKATKDDIGFEIGQLSLLREYNPELISDREAPIWQIIGIGLTGEKIDIWRDGDNKQLDGYILLREFPFTHWRVADAFIDTAHPDIERELYRLQSIWRVSSREGVYIQATNRLGTGLSYLNNAHIVHGNLQWYWHDTFINKTYARPNPHNIALDGSLGDFEESLPDLYGHHKKDIDIQEILGAFSIYTLLIAKINPEMLEDSVFITSYIDTFLDSLPYDVKRRMSRSPQTKELINGYAFRLQLSRAGYRTMTRMEYFDDRFFIYAGPLLLNILEKVVSQ